MAVLGETIALSIQTSTLETTEFTGESKAALLNLIYPVGSIYVYQGNTSTIPGTCPIQSALGGTWVKIEGFLYSSTTYYKDTGGSPKGWWVDHRHGVTGPNSDQTIETDNSQEAEDEGYVGAHAHNLYVDDESMGTQSDGPCIEVSSNERRAEIDAYTVKDMFMPYGSSRNSGDHRHRIIIEKNSLSTTSDLPSLDSGMSSKLDKLSLDSGGRNPETANLPPYVGVIAWRRSA